MGPPALPPKGAFGKGDCRAASFMRLLPGAGDSQPTSGSALAWTAMDDHELVLLQRSQATREVVDVVVSGCAYSCCGKGWQRRDGYEQAYRGWIDNLKLPDGRLAGTFMLYSAGIGTLSYVIACRFWEVVEVRPVAVAA